MTHNTMSQNVETRLRERRKVQTMLLIALWVAVLLVVTLLCSAQANAQMNNQQWGFSPQNRASIAALMQQVERNDSTGTVAATAGSVETLVCGGGGSSSSATANSSCIILNNSAASLDLGQDSEGSQDANSGVGQEDAQSIADQMLEALAEQ